MGGGGVGKEACQQALPGPQGRKTGSKCSRGPKRGTQVEVNFTLATARGASRPGRSEREDGPF